MFDRLTSTVVIALQGTHQQAGKAAAATGPASYGHLRPAAAAAAYTGVRPVAAPGYTGARPASATGYTGARPAATAAGGHTGVRPAASAAPARPAAYHGVRVRVNCSSRHQPPPTRVQLLLHDVAMPSC